MKKQSSRRVLLAALLLTFVSGVARPQPEEESLSLLERTARALEQASTAIANLWEAVVPHDGGEERARLSQEDRERLTDLSARLQNVFMAQQVQALPEIQAYIAEPNERRWRNVQSMLEAILVDVDDLVEDFGSERSDFVLEEAYGQLLVSLATRGGLARRLVQLPRPESDEELLELAEVEARYGELVAALQDLVLKLNDYVRSAETD